MLHSLYLVRHGEVHNPDHVVYADLDGFHLSEVGRRQAMAAAANLAARPVDALATSPLDRAIETATPIAATVGMAAERDARLTEWTLGRRWAGVRWDQLPQRFPGEVEAYLDQPTDLEFGPETISEVALRMASVVHDLGNDHPGGRAIIVSHQDPIQALRLVLTDRSLSQLQVDKPGHGSVITFEPDGEHWTEVASWSPEVKSAAFPPVDDPDAT